MKFEPETGYQSYSSFSALNQPWLRIEGATSSGSASASSRSRNLVMDGLGRLLSECSTFNGSTAARNFTYSGAFLTDSSNSVTGANAYTVTQHFDYFEASQGAFLKDEITTQLGLTSMIQYTYTDLGVLNSLTYPDGRVVNYGFDNLGRAITVTTSLNGVTQSIIPAPPSSPFDQWGNRGSITFQSGAKDTWGRDAHGRLGSTTVIPASGSPVGWSYQYDPTTGWLTSTGEWGLGLDSMGRLTSASQAWALALDSNGNATQSNVGLLSNDLVQDAFSNNTYTNTTSTAALPAAINNFSITNPLVSNQLPGFDKNGALIGATYDLFSEITQINTAIGTGSPTLSMAWDPLGRLATVGQSRTSAAQGYHYAPSGVRVASMDLVDASNNRAYIYTTNGQLLSEYVTSANAVKSATPVDLWANSSSGTMTVPASGWVGQAPAPQPCVPGDVFYAGAYVRTVGMTTGTAHIGIRFDSDTQIGIGWSQVLGDGTPPSTTSPDRIRLGCMGIAPAGATKAVFYIECGPCNPGAMASIDSIAFSKGSPLSSTSAAIPLDLWTGGSAAVFTIPASGWVGQAPAPQACVPGDVFYAGAYVRTVGMTTGTAHIGIRFDSDTQIGIGWSQVLGDGTPPSTISPDRIRLGCMGIAPAGATKALFYIECGPCNPGAIASFDTVAFTKGLSTSSNSMVGSRDVIYLDGRAIAEMDSAGLVHELHNDHLGTPRLITNGITGSVEGSQTYGPYGETIGGWGYVPLTGYTGHIQTEPNGLIYMRGRFYSPAWHQFLNSDQGADPAQGNQYAYAGGNPFTRVDPSGMFSWSLPRLLSAFGHSLAHLGTQIFNSMNQGGYGEMQQFASEFVADQRNRWKSQQTDLTAQEDDSTDFAGASNTKLSVSPGIAGTDVATTGIVINYTDLPMMTPEPNTITWMAHGLPGVVEGVTPEQMASDAKGFKGWEAASKYLAVCYGGSGVLGRDGSIRLQPIAQRVADALGPNQVVNGDQYLHRQNWSGGSTTRLDSYLGGKSWFVNAGWIPTHWLSYTAGTSRTSGEIQVPYGCFVVPNR
ncbi:MAG: RHS repeat-associated core domain-containing protein [Acidobacteria bacterium]|nr:RHS repeat-associated core domain-containing protein [Acidobacteriota bacterium]